MNTFNQNSWIQIFFSFLPSTYSSLIDRSLFFLFKAKQAIFCNICTMMTMSRSAHYHPNSIMDRQMKTGWKFWRDVDTINMTFVTSSSLFGRNCWMWFWWENFSLIIRFFLVIPLFGFMRCVSEFGLVKWYK